MMAHLSQSGGYRDLTICMLFEGHSRLRVIGEIQANEKLPVLCFVLKRSTVFIQTDAQSSRRALS